MKDEKCFCGRIHNKKIKSWGIHVDTPWSYDVREFGAPLRAYIRTPRIFITIALWPGHGSQVYDWKRKRWTDKWSWITIHPIHR